MSLIFHNGISSNSTFYFHTPDQNQPDFLAWPLCAGHYFCDSSYEVNRSSYDSFLILSTKSGKGTITTGSVTHHLVPGAVCLLDCYEPHHYIASDFWEIEWIHFDGGSCRDYFDYLRKGEPFFCTQLAASAEFEVCWRRLYETLLKKDKRSPLILSQDIMQLLTLLGTSNEKYSMQKEAADCIDASLKYIHRHLDEDLTLPELASRAALSPFYFSRRFKARTGYTPHRYILISRINLAKFLLKSSQSTVKSIGFHCGFNSEHSFCAAFKKETGSTPSEYRSP